MRVWFMVFGVSGALLLVFSETWRPVKYYCKRNVPRNTTHDIRNTHPQRVPEIRHTKHETRKKIIRF